MLLLVALVPFWPTTAPEAVVAAIWSIANLVTLALPYGDGGELRSALRTHAAEGASRQAVSPPTISGSARASAPG